MGWTAEETALCSGHKVKGEEGAQSAYVDRLTVAIASAERLWARYYGTQGGTGAANWPANQQQESHPEGWLTR